MNLTAGDNKPSTAGLGELTRTPEEARSLGRTTTARLGPMHSRNRNFSVDSDQFRARTDLFCLKVMTTRAASGVYGKALHWSTVLLVILAWALEMCGDELSEGSARESGLLAHIWIGLAVLLFAAVRIPWRIANPPPKIVPTEFSRWLIEWTDPTSRVVHYVLYTLLVLVPIFGIALQFAQGHSLPLFGLVEIPSPWVADKAFAGNLQEVHEILANFLVALALLHMTAALIYHWVSVMPH
jgi:cytochrome b561